MTEHQSHYVDPAGFQGIAEAKGYSQEYSRIKKTRYSHETMIEILILEPGISQGQLAAKFGYTEAWISRIYGSDAFQAALAARRREVTDPILVASIEEKISGLAHQSLDIIADKLAATKSADLAMKAAELAVKALGFGARAGGGGGQVNNFVVQLPEKAETAATWLAGRTMEPARVIEHREITE